MIVYALVVEWVMIGYALVVECIRALHLKYLCCLLCFAGVGASQLLGSHMQLTVAVIQNWPGGRVSLNKLVFRMLKWNNR